MNHRDKTTDATRDVWGMVRIAASAINKKKGCLISALLLADLMSDATYFAELKKGDFYWIIREHGTNIIENNIEAWYETINDCPDWVVFNVVLDKRLKTFIISEIEVY